MWSSNRHSGNNHHGTLLAAESLPLVCFISSVVFSVISQDVTPQFANILKLICNVHRMFASLYVLCHDYCVLFLCLYSHWFQVKENKTHFAQFLLFSTVISRLDILTLLLWNQHHSSLPPCGKRRTDIFITNRPNKTFSFPETMSGKTIMFNVYFREFQAHSGTMQPL